MTELVEPSEERRAAAAALDVLLAAGYRETRLPPWLDYDRVRDGLDRARVDSCKFVAPDGRVLLLLPDPTLGVLQSLGGTGGQAVRVCYWADVFRVVDGRWTRGAQVGAELLGPVGLDVDLEVVDLALAAAAAAGCRQVRLVLNDAGLTEGLCGMLPPAEAARARRALEAGDFVEVREAARSRPEVAEALRYAGPAADVRSRLKTLPLPASVEARLAHLEQVAAAAARRHPAAGVVIDAGMVREIGYYDGLVFQVIEAGTGRVLAAGGRYDALAQAADPACGGGVGFACDAAALAAAARAGGAGERGEAPWPAAGSR